MLNNLFYFPYLDKNQCATQTPAICVTRVLAGIAAIIDGLVCICTLGFVLGNFQFAIVLQSINYRKYSE